MMRITANETIRAPDHRDLLWSSDAGQSLQAAVHVAQALLLCRVMLSRFMFSNARFQQGLRRRRWRRLSTSLFGEEKRCNHPGLYQVEPAKREDVVRKASKS
jgi:hypothetical protein